MSFDIPTWLGVIGALFTIVAVVAGAVAVVFSKATTSRQTLLESNNRTLAERVDLLEDEINRKDTEHAAQVKEYQAQIKALQEKVAVLEKVVTGREMLEHLTDLVTAHDKRVDSFFQELQKHDKDSSDRADDLKGLMIANKRLLHDLLEVVQSEQETT